MKLSVKWLKEYVDTRLSPEKIADRLTMAGFEVDEIALGHSYSGVVVGLVLSVEKHPNATKLNIASVDVGGEILQIVCGAPNLKVGQKVPVAIVGAKLGDYEISKASLRGVDSHGMICSERELGLGDEHSGIMILEKSEKIGEVYISDKGSDSILDVKVLANRPDCMSIVGLAREVAVVTGSKLKVSVIPGRQPGTQPGKNVDFTIKVADPTLCPRYMARFVTGLGAGSGKLESPQWMKERLLSAGVRPISLYVDISNYVMLEYGQPLHFFDLDKLTDKAIHVRPAKGGETLVTLDGVTRTLTRTDLVIADLKKPIALAGVMGGADTEIDDKTTNILIEAAVFDKASIRRTSRALGLRSEAVARFEKGIPLSFPEVAIARAVQLLVELGGGRVSATSIDIQKKKVTSKRIAFDVAAMNAFLGTSLSDAEATRVLTSLGFVLTKKGKSYQVQPPYWRVDVVENVDLYEEVIRVVGYDKVPMTMPKNVDIVPEKNRYFECATRVRNQLIALGFSEIMTYSFIGSSELTAVGADVTSAPVVQNPLVSDQQHLRPTLVPQMLQTIRDNQFHQDTLKFFEIGRSFENTKPGQLPQETNWLVLGTSTGFYDAKGYIYHLLTSLGIGEDEIVARPTSATFIKSGIGADLFVQGKKLVSFGEVREEVRVGFDIIKTATVAQMDLDLYLSLQLASSKYEAFSRFQRVSRDVSAVFDVDIAVGDIVSKLARASKLLQKLEIIDIYKGKGLSSTERSITIRFYIQSDERTLTDAEVDMVMQTVNGKILEIGGKPRSGKEK